MPQMYFMNINYSQWNDQNPEYMKRYRLNSILFSAPENPTPGYYLLASARIPGNPGHNVISPTYTIPNYNIIHAIPVTGTETGIIFFEPKNNQWIDVDSSLFLYNFVLLHPTTLQAIAAPSVFNLVLDYEK